MIPVASEHILQVFANIASVLMIKLACILGDDVLIAGKIAGIGLVQRAISHCTNTAEEVCVPAGLGSVETNVVEAKHTLQRQLVNSRAVVIENLREVTARQLGVNRRVGQLQIAAISPGRLI